MLNRTIAIAVLAACSHPIPEPIAAHGGTPAAAHDPRVVLDYMRMAVEARDAHAYAALYANDAVLQFAGTRTVHGRTAIEALMRDAFAPAASIRIGFPRLWIKGDVAIAEAVFHATHPASSGMHDVGETEVFVMTFDGDGRIAHEEVYADQAMLDAQADGDKDADPIPVMPKATEVHVANANTNDAAVIAWTHAAEATFSNDEADATLIDENAAWDCVLGFHGTNREQLAKALVHWRKAFPDTKLVATAVWPVDDYVILEETFTGTHSAEIADIPASHRPVSWKWLKIWRVDHGKIVRGWQWGDWKELESQISTPSQPKHKPACSIAS